VKKVRLFSLGAAIRMLLVTILAAAGYAAQAYRNPVVRGMNPDPSVVRVGADYYLTTSSFEYFPSCPVYHSRDLVHWERVGYALERPEQFEALHDEHLSTYACTLRYHAGTFYALTTDVRGGGNFLVTAKDVAGPWSLPIPIDKGMFDPSLFFDDDGTVYYTRRGPDPHHDIVQAKIDVATGKLSGELRTISNGYLMDGAEGPHLYKFGGWYYLSLAEGGSRFLHMQTIGRARSPWGPFEADPENPWASQHVSWDYPVLTVGHCDLVDTPAGAWWTVCLGTRHFNSRHFSIGRETFLFPVKWKDGWPSVSTEDMRSLDVQHATPADYPARPEPVRDNFSATKLGMEWNVLGPAGLKAMSLTERPGFLRLHGEAALSFAQTTAFVGRRQTEWNTVSTVRMEFAPTADGEMAGLTVFMSPHYHYDVCKVQHDGKSYVELIKQVSDMHEVTREVEVAKGPLLLRVESTAETYRFSFASEGGTWVDLGSGDERQIASEIANVWSGIYIAMFALNPQPERVSNADFDWFEYRTQIR
jgi:xylan 1,4-beta-xylosidase